MALSPAEKAIAEAAYARVKSRNGAGLIGSFVGIFIVLGQSVLKDFRDPHTSRLDLIILTALIGVAFGACIVSSIFLSRQRKRDLDLVGFFEDRFPEDCSWKQEEKILAQADDLRLKAKIDWLIHHKV